MKITGACHCGAIQFRAEVDPSQVLVCHCADCQTLTGSAFRVNAPAAFVSFKLTAGTPKTYTKVAESGAKRLQGFCGDCGTPLYAVAAINPERIFLRWGAIHQRHALHPTVQIWCQSKADWVNALAALSGSDQQQALMST
jgi:hypothetical protein